MSQKITAKNLSYDANPPPFLAALQARALSGSRAPDPIIAARRRGVKTRSASEAAEDAPLVVDEQGNEVGVEVGEDGTVKDAEGEREVGDDATEPDKGREHTGSGKVAGIGGARKRKAGKVVGDAANVDAQADAVDGDRGTKTKKEARPGGKKDTVADSGKEKSRKKSKKIKLSFNDDGD
jgi:hypothetical protein